MGLVLSFFHGFALALGLILPLGVQNVFIFTQGAYHKNLIKALPAVIAAALSDTFLILLAVCGVSVAVLEFNWLRNMLLIIGVFFLLYMASVTWRSSTGLNEKYSDLSAWPVSRQVIFALSVSLLNPHAILDTIGVIGTSSLSYSGDDRIFFTAACILVSWLWFCFLALAGHLLKAIDKSGKLFSIVNKFSAGIMVISALYLFKKMITGF